MGNVQLSVSSSDILSSYFTYLQSIPATWISLDILRKFSHTNSLDGSSEMTINIGLLAILVNKWIIYIHEGMYFIQNSIKTVNKWIIYI